MGKMNGLVLLVMAGCFVLSSGDLAKATDPASFEETSFGGIVETIEGAVTAVDTEKKIITVRWMVDPVMMRYENITLKVVPATVIIKNGFLIELRDVESGDHVTARYAPYAAPVAKALSLDIEE